MLNGNPYSSYNQKNKQASLSNREVRILFKQIQKIPYMQKTWHAVQKTMLKSSIFELLPSVTRTYLLYSALQDTTVLTIPRIHNLISSEEKHT